MKQERLTALRKEMGLSQKELAQELGISASAVGMYEQGRREPDHQLLVRMAEFFGSSVDYLLGNDLQYDQDAMTEEIMQNLSQQTQLMFRSGELSEEDYTQLKEAIRIAVEIAVKRDQEKKKGKSN